MEKEKERIIFLKGKKVILRPLRKDTDLEKTLRWMNDSDITQYLIARYLPLSLAEETTWFDDWSKRQNDVALAIETIDGVFIGIAGLHRLRWKDRVAEHGIFIGEKDHWENGYGTDVGMTLLDYAFNRLNLHKVRSALIAFNKRSLNYHLKCGYKVVGAYRKEVFERGKYYDVILLEVFKKDWLPSWKKYQKNE